MSDTPKMKTRNKVIMWVAISLGALVLLLIALGTAIRLFVIDSSHVSEQSDSAYHSSFLESCQKGTLAQGASTEFALGYCGCVYDDGVKQLGDAEFKRQAASLGQSGNAVADLTAIAKACGNRYADYN